MPRPPRCRRVCSLPVSSTFGPVDRRQSDDTVAWESMNMKSSALSIGSD